MKLKTNKIFLISGIAIVLLFLIAAFPSALGLNQSVSIYLAFAWTLLFGVNVTGLVLGIGKYKKGQGKAKFGIIGTMFFILLFLSVLIYSVMSL